MKVSFTPQRENYIDYKGKELMAMVLVKENIKQLSTLIPQSEKGYLRHKPEAINITEFLVGPMSTSTKHLNGRYSEKYREEKKHLIGLNDQGFETLYKLTLDIFKEQSFRENISETFLVDLIFDFLIDNYNKSEDIYLSDFLLDKCNEAVIPYNLYFPVLYLESNQAFTIGVTQFQYLTQEYVDALVLKVNESRKSDYAERLSKFKGQIFATCSINAEKKKAIEIASEQITFSVDVLRILSPAIEFPDILIYYDVDFKNRFQLKSDVLVQKMEEEEHITINMNAQIRPFEISRLLWDAMIAMGLESIHKFILKTLDKKTELEGVIYNAIRNLSKAVGTHDLHERITLIFTVLESLLLPNDGSAIMESVCKYLPQLISNKLEERKKIIKTVKDLYKVRSAMIHHAKKIDFNMEDLAFLQICSRALIIVFISMSYQKRSKMEILNEIDDKIISA